MIASEAQPFSKTGGLADVASALPKALGQLGPRRHADHAALSRHRRRPGRRRASSIEVAAHRFAASLIEARIGPGARVLLLDCPELYDRAGHLLRRRGDYPTTRFDLRFCRPPRSIGPRSRTIRSTSFTRTTGRAASRRSMRAASGTQHLAPWHPYGFHHS